MDRRYYNRPSCKARLEGWGVKIKFDIDCTPEEARAFLGLPDVVPLQTAMMAEVEKRMKDGLAAMSPEAILNTWLPAGVRNLEEMQKMFWAQFPGAQRNTNKD